MGMIEYLYGSEYAIHPLLISAADVGHAGTSRDRLYVILAHKHHVKQICDVQGMLQHTTHVLRKVVQTTPQDYLFANAQQKRLEALHVARVRKIQYQPRVTWQHTTTCPRTPPHPTAPGTGNKPTHPPAHPLIPCHQQGSNRTE